MKDKSIEMGESSREKTFWRFNLFIYLCSSVERFPEFGKRNIGLVISKS